MMQIDECVRSRHSVRNYLDKKIEPLKVDVLRRLINEYNEEASLNIQLVLDNPEAFSNFILNYGKIKNCNNYIALIGDKCADLEEKCGYYGEKLVLKAQELGLNTCWVAATYNKNSLLVNIKEKQKLVCIIAIGYGRYPGHERKSKSFDDVSKSKNVPDWYKKGIEYALLAPTALNQQKFVFTLNNDQTVSIKRKLGPYTKIDLGIVKFHFELGAGKHNFKWK